MPRRPVMALCVVVCTAALIRLPRVQVAGTSMVPTLWPGDRVVVVPLRPRSGRLVVVNDPRDPSRTLIKRAGRIHTDHGIQVLGDNPDASTDSRQFGSVPASAVKGRPVYRYQPATAKGWLWNA
ncbi:hypothetical protein BH24ACT15_BH24ACT15_03540 [soil metagenome]